MRVSLGTNVLVSAFTTRGICADVIAVVLGEHQLVLGETVLGELTRVLREKMRMPEGSVVEAEAFLRQEAAVISRGSAIDAPIRDPDNVEVLAEAMEGLADVLVTGDRDLLDVADQLPVEVLSPRGFWEKLHQASLQAPPNGICSTSNAAQRPLGRKGNESLELARLTPDEAEERHPDIPEVS